MKDNIQKEKFIELRAKGFSFDKISRELKISKPTLIKWQTELNKEISNLEYLDYQNIIEQHKLSRTVKIKKLSAMLEKVWKELEKRDLSDVSIKDLIRMKAELQTELNFATFDIKYQTGEYEDHNFEEKTIGL